MELQIRNCKLARCVEITESHLLHCEAIVIHILTF